MLFQFLRQALSQGFICVIQRIDQCYKQWSQPANDNLLVGTTDDLTRNKSELVAENAFLRQQLIVLRRQSKRPVLTSLDRSKFE